jgi:hypothetical protein
MDEIKRHVRAWSRWARLQQGIGLSFVGLSCGLALALILALAARLAPLLDRPTLIGLSAALAVAGLLAALLLPWVRHARTPLVAWARAFDQRFDLKDRLSTALEIGEAGSAPPVLRHAQHRDAGAVARSIDVRARLPLRVPRRDLIAASILLVALLLALFLPSPQQEALAQQEQIRRFIAQQAEQLEQAKQAIAESSLSEPQKQAAIQALEEAQRALSDPDVTLEEALAALNEAQSKLDALNDPAARQLTEDLRRAGQSLPADPLTNPLANALTNQELAQAADALRELGQARPDGQPLDEAASQRAADQLDQLARGVQESAPDLARHLREAAQHLRQGELAAAQQQLEQAARLLERAQTASQADQAMERAREYTEAARQSIAQQASSPSANTPQRESRGQQTESSSPADASGAAGQDASQNNAAGDGRAAGGAPTAPGDASSASQTGKSDDVGTSNAIYAPRRVGGEGQQVVLPDARSPTAPDPSGRAAPAPVGSSSVPYERVYADYARAADEALQRGRVPPDMRDYVRDYFSSLDPARRNR